MLMFFFDVLDLTQPKKKKIKRHFSDQERQFLAEFKVPYASTETTLEFFGFPKVETCKKLFIS